jgi:tRNA-specific 2-thiouridylase
MKSTSLDNSDIMVKTRSTQQPVPARLTQNGDCVTVTFREAQKGISPGQAAVFYNNDGDILGGGIIEKSLD